MMRKINRAGATGPRTLETYAGSFRIGTPLVLNCVKSSIELSVWKPPVEEMSKV
jgi:hypothetical protein